MTGEVIGDKDGFYSKAKKYWKNIPPTVDGILGGLRAHRHQLLQAVSAEVRWGHLTDKHLTQFLKRCQKDLRPNGIICVKDNVCQEGVIEDEVDSSVCRDLGSLRTIVRLAGLQVLAEEKQDDFPDEIYQVYSLALR